jgi:hypothetical protein
LGRQPEIVFLVPTGADSCRWVLIGAVFGQGWRQLPAPIGTLTFGRAAAIGSCFAVISQTREQVELTGSGKKLFEPGIGVDWFGVYVNTPGRGTAAFKNLFLPAIGCDSLP